MWNTLQLFGDKYNEFQTIEEHALFEGNQQEFIAFFTLCKQS